jgi:hypothetical protein
MSNSIYHISVRCLLSWITPDPGSYDVAFRKCFARGTAIWLAVDPHTAHEWHVSCAPDILSSLPRVSKNGEPLSGTFYETEHYCREASTDASRRSCLRISCFW